MIIAEEEKHVSPFLPSHAQPFSFFFFPAFNECNVGQRVPWAPMMRQPDYISAGISRLILSYEWATLQALWLGRWPDRGGFQHVRLICVTTALIVSNQDEGSARPNIWLQTASCALFSYTHVEGESLRRWVTGGASWVMVWFGSCPTHWNVLTFLWRYNRKQPPWNRVRVNPCESNKILNRQETVSLSENASPPQQSPLTVSLSSSHSCWLCSNGQYQDIKHSIVWLKWAVLNSVGNLESLEVRLYQNGWDSFSAESWI